MLDEFDVKATFFVVADVVAHYPGLVSQSLNGGMRLDVMDCITLVK